VLHGAYFYPKFASGQDILSCSVNSHTSLHRRHPSLPDQWSSTFSDPPDLSTFNGGGGGGAEKWFSPASVPPNVCVLNISDPPPLLFPLTTYPPLQNIPNHHQYHSPHPATVILLLHTICPILHTRYPIKTFPVTVNRPVTTPCHNRHLLYTLKPCFTSCYAIF
jgi:hypothetical protein